MYKEIQCPYCEESFDLCHDDGAYYNHEEELEECQCPECEKYFMVQSSQSWDFEGFKADCLNGSPHDWKQENGYPKAYYHGRFKCSMCDKEERRDEEGRKKLLQEYSDSINGLHK